ncbi:hypothetical protein SHPE106448_21120 [Shewanella pealeana]
MARELGNNLIAKMLLNIAWLVCDVRFDIYSNVEAKLYKLLGLYRLVKPSTFESSNSYMTSISPAQLKIWFGLKGSLSISASELTPLVTKMVSRPA